jgi:type II secretory pathway component GspD/PulD (secretin)
MPAAGSRRDGAPAVIRGRRAALALVAALGLSWTAPAAPAAPPGPGAWAVLSALQAPAQPQARPSRAHVALNTGIECNRRGDYEQAAVLFRQAQDGLTDLSPTEQEELARWVQSNSAALQARQEGAMQLAQAEQAVASGRAADAAELLKKVLGNQYVTAADKQKAQQLAERTRPLTAAPVPAGQGNPAALSLARSKLQQARTLMGQGNYDAAEQLANEAQALNVVYLAGEDTPAKVLEDSYKGRNDPKALLAAARAALKRGDLDRAEALARMSAQAESSWNVHIWGDSPAQVLKDVQAARAKAPAPGAHGPSKPLSAETAPDTRPPGFQGDRGTLLGSMKSLFSTSNKPEGDAQAQDRPAPVQPPEARPQPPGVPAAQAAADKNVPDDPRALLRRGRELFIAGQYDQATSYAQKAKAAGNGRWGIFEDSPDKLQQDVDEARAQHDREESVKVLAEARRLYEQGEYEKASREAYRAQKLHGPYSWWDLGDRPLKLLAEIETKKSQNRQHGGPAAETAVAREQGRPGADQPPQDPRAAQARQMLAQARQALQGGDVARAQAIVQEVQPISASLSSTDDRIQLVALTQEIESAHGPGPNPAAAAPGLPYAAPAMPAQSGAAVAGPVPGNPAKAQAQQLLAQCRQLQREGRLVEARQKALEAQATRAVFAPTDDSPELALIQLSALCYKQIDSLMQQAADYQQTAGGNPANYQKAEQDLQQAHQLAAGFGFDTSVVEAKMRGLGQMRAAAGGAVPAGPVAAAGEVRVAGGQAPPASAGPGQAVLAQARQELRKGETKNARKLAEDVYNGPYGLREQAEALLRSIDAEEFAQQRLAADRTYEAGMSAFRRKDYTQAAAILRAVNPRLLEDDKQARLKNVFSLPEMQPGQVAQVSGQEPPPGPGAGTAHVSDLPPAAHGKAGPDQDLLKITQAMQDIKFQQLRQQGLEVQREAAERFRSGDTDRAVELLQEYVENLSTTQLDADRVALLRRPIESRLLTFKTLKAQRAFEDEAYKGRQAVAASRSKTEMTKINKEKKVAELMQQYKSFYEQAKYKEAEMYAMAAFELDPDNAIAGAAVQIARVHRRQVEYQNLKDKKEENWLESANASEDVGDYVDPKVGVHFDPETTRRNIKERTDLSRPIISTLQTDKTKEIEHQLTKPVSLSFNNAPLEQVLEDLRAWHGLNIVPDMAALDSEGITLKAPVTIKLDNVMLKSALNLLLRQVHLTYVIKDEVLQITTPANASGKLVTATYQVADLVVPIDNYSLPNSANLPKQLDQASHPLQMQGLGSTTPYLSQYAMNGGSQASSPGYTPGGGQASMTSTTIVKSQSATMEDALIKLITNTIAPQTWDSMGGPGTINYYPLAMSLVINQTPDIQEQIFDLLQALRRLQDQEVAIEMRFITVAEGFFERIGVDFNIDIQNNSMNARFGPQLTTQQFQQAGFINNFAPDRFISGLTPAGALTSDLSIPIQNSSFAMAVPPFGGFPNIPGADGGISLGLAFLSECQVFLLLEAAQGDQRTNVMQAPKLTLSNGQTAAISVTDQQFFVTNVQVIQQGGQLAFLPQNTNFATGVNMTIQATISADRRFVRVSFSQVTLSNLASAIIPLFPIVTPVIPTFEGGFQANPVLFTQFLQQPVFDTVTVSTTVTIPDGGTVVLGGLKRLSEGRNEFGPPVLSKIPYLQRLFRNQAFGREVESLLIMVTPRVIINEEEEFRQTGVGAGGPGGP